MKASSETNRNTIDAKGERSLPLDCIVVGAGFSGMLSALMLAEKGLDVLLLEHMDCAGKKLLMTGNGECNIAPSDFVFTDAYVSGSPDHENKMAEILGNAPVEDVISFWKKYGVRLVEKNGGLYPNGGGAKAIRDVLLLSLDSLNVSISYNVGIRSIKKAGELFSVETKTGIFTSKAVLLATGGTSYKKTGSDGSGFLYLKTLGHECTALSPALCAMTADDEYLRKASGVRVKCRVELYEDGEMRAREEGILQITDYGISGICVFNLSLYHEETKDIYVIMDMLPEYDEDGLVSEYEALCKTAAFSGRKGEDIFTGLLPEKLISAVYGSLKGKNDIRSFIHHAKHYKLDITGIKGFDMAQVTKGGVSLDDIDVSTMGSKKTKGLFFAGEMTDVAGKCGGYNLLYAHHTAKRASEGVAKCLD